MLVSMSSATFVIADLGQPAAVPVESTGAAVVRNAPMRPAELACVLLLLQASMAMVSSAIVLFLGATGFPVPLARLGGFGLLALAHPVFLAIMAVGVARSWRGTRRAAIVFEALTIGGM